MLQNIDHINIVVSNLDASLHFYKELLGFEETRRAVLTGDWIEDIVGLKNVTADVVYLELKSGPRIELLHYQSPPGQVLPANSSPNTIGLRHLAFRVNDIDVLHHRLKESGVEFISKPTAVPQSAVQHDAGHKHLCYLKDPDGVILEFAEYK